MLDGHLSRKQECLDIFRGPRYNFLNFDSSEMKDYYEIEAFQPLTIWATFDLELPRSDWFFFWSLSRVFKASHIHRATETQSVLR